MKNVFIIVCRGSWLSLAQVELFKSKVAKYFPAVELKTLIKETKGDREQSTPLHLIEGKDFFTAEIQEDLRSGKADFAVHSMKDVSGDHFFEQSFYRILDRDDIRDVVIFNKNIIEKLKNNQPIVIGTSSPRRTKMATAFLQKALPQFSESPIDLQTKPIRGNVDGRLKKLSDTGEFDGIVLAMAGLNRLLAFEQSKQTVQLLLSDKKIMVLPLFECPPAAGQGAIVAETNIDNLDAIEVLTQITDKENTIAIQEERLIANTYGYGCSQPFGVFHLSTPTIAFTYAAGTNIQEENFTEWHYKLPELNANQIIFSGSDYMKDFFTETYLEHTKIDSSSKALFIASHKCLHNTKLIQNANNKRVWVAGSKTWLALAKKGIWVEGSADGLGLESILPTMNNSLMQLSKNQFTILTNNNSVVNWLADGYDAVASYTLHPSIQSTIIKEIAAADFIFWASFQQYQIAQQYAKPTALHACASGKSADRLMQLGIRPFIFPTIKAFIAWKAKATLATAAE